MFGRGEKLKRLEAENKLIRALEEIEELRNKLKHKDEEIGRLSRYETESVGLHEKIKELGGKIREQTEADLLMASCKIIKALVIDEKPKNDPTVEFLLNVQRDAYNQYLAGSYGYRNQGLSGLASLGRLF